MRTPGVVAPRCRSARASLPSPRREPVRPPAYSSVGPMGRRAGSPRLFFRAVGQRMDVGSTCGDEDTVHTASAAGPRLPLDSRRQLRRGRARSVHRQLRDRGILGSDRLRTHRMGLVAVDHQPARDRRQRVERPPVVPVSGMGLDRVRERVRRLPGPVDPGARQQLRPGRPIRIFGWLQAGRRQPSSASASLRSDSGWGRTPSAWRRKGLTVSTRWAPVSDSPPCPVKRRAGRGQFHRVDTRPAPRPSLPLRRATTAATAPLGPRPLSPPPAPATAAGTGLRAPTAAAPS